MVLHTNVGRGGGALHTFKYILSQNLVDVQHSARYSIQKLYSGQGVSSKTVIRVGKGQGSLSAYI